MTFHIWRHCRRTVVCTPGFENAQNLYSTVFLQNVVDIQMLIKLPSS